MCKQNYSTSCQGEKSQQADMSCAKQWAFSKAGTLASSMIGIAATDVHRELLCCCRHSETASLPLSGRPLQTATFVSILSHFTAAKAQNGAQQQEQDATYTAKQHVNFELCHHSLCCMKRV